MPKGFTKVSVNLDPDEHHRIKVCLAEKGVSFQETFVGVAENIIAGKTTDLSGFNREEVFTHIQRINFGLHGLLQSGNMKGLRKIARQFPEIST